MNYNFYLLSKTKKTINYVSKILINFPNKEYVLKNNIEKCMYDMIECIFSYQVNDSNRIKLKCLKDFLVKLSMVNYYIDISLEKKFISKKQHESVGKFLAEIRKIAYGVQNGDGLNKV